MDFNLRKVALNENQTRSRIRERKYYWHKDVNIETFKDNKFNVMCQRVRPLKANIESDLKPTVQCGVYFEQLDKKQLEQLKYAIDFGNPECAHKMGRGKPLGISDALEIMPNWTKAFTCELSNGKEQVN